jgi:hypothetical protein
VSNPARWWRLIPAGNADTPCSACGLLTAAVLQIRGARWAILGGIAAAALVAMMLGKIHFAGVIGLPHINTAAAFAWTCAPR